MGEIGLSSGQIGFGSCRGTAEKGRRRYPGPSAMAAGTGQVGLRVPFLVLFVGGAELRFDIHHIRAGGTVDAAVEAQ